MDPNSSEKPPLSLRERLFKTWFPPAAAIGGMAMLVAAVFRQRPAARTVVAPPGGPAPAVPAPGAQAATAPAMASPLLQVARASSARPTAGPLARQYRLERVFGEAASAAAFHLSLNGVALDSSDRLHTLGDGEIRVFAPDGSVARRWKVAETAESLAVGPDGRVYVGGSGRVDVYSPRGDRIGGFAFGDKASPAAVSAVKIYRDEILVADASARIIRRFDAAGRQLGVIGDRGATKTFMLPNGKLDLDVDAAGVVRATDTGRHQVTAWQIDGTPVGRFGKFGMSDPADFVGCCNPVNLASTRDGMVVTGEKMVARVKVFTAAGVLMAVIGPEHFDPMCTQIHLAADAKGRVYAADPVRRRIQVFAPEAGGAR